MNELERHLNSSNMDPAQAQAALNAMKILNRYCEGRECEACPFSVEAFSLHYHCIFSMAPENWSKYLKEADNAN